MPDQLLVLPDRPFDNKSNISKSPIPQPLPISKMSVETFVHTDLYRDVVKALDTEWYRYFAHYLGNERPTAWTDRYQKVGFPLPPNGQICWCHPRSRRRCRAPNTGCPNVPEVRVGEGFHIVRCTNSHGETGSQSCGVRNCFQYSEAIPQWARLVCFEHERYQLQTRISSADQENIAGYIRSYGFSERRVQSYTNHVCILIENFRRPLTNMNMLWKPEIHGVHYLKHTAIDQVVTTILTRWAAAKFQRESAAAATT